MIDSLELNGDYQRLLHRMMPSRANGPEISRRVLAAELDRAKEHVVVTKTRYKDIIASVPDGTPDSNLQIHQAGAEYRKALVALDRALKQWTDFVENGIVPPSDTSICAPSELGQPRR